MKEKVIIKNSFFDIIGFLISFIFGFFRGFLFLFKKNKNKTNQFFDFLDFIFRKWPFYFWKFPSFYKITSLPADILNFLLKK